MVILMNEGYLLRAWDKARIHRFLEKDHKAINNGILYHIARAQKMGEFN